MLIGKTLKEAEQIKNTDIVEETSFTACKKFIVQFLAEDAIKAAIKDLQLT
jgi:NifU-like protein involved in Fe-S cluster formation